MRLTTTLIYRAEQLLRLKTTPYLTNRGAPVTCIPDGRYKQYVLLLSPLDPEKKTDTQVHKALRHIGDTIGYKNQGNKSGCVDGVNVSMEYVQY